MGSDTQRWRSVHWLVNQGQRAAQGQRAMQVQSDIFLGWTAIAGHQFEHHAGYSGVMLGMPTDQVHLEFTHANAGSPCPAPTKDNLLVLYLTDDEAHAELVQRMKNHGHAPVAPENPYWKNDSLTFEDPDGWRVVIYRGPAFRSQYVRLAARRVSRMRPTFAAKLRRGE